MTDIVERLRGWSGQATPISSTDIYTMTQEAADEIERLRRALDLAILRINTATGIAIRYGGIDGAHHKQWVIDQMMRELAVDDYEALVRQAKDGDDGPDTYEWDEGIAP
jgi:hypothetical protein